MQLKFLLLQAIMVLEKITATTQKMKFSIKDFFSKCDQIRSFLWIWSHLLKKSLTENFILCAVCKESFENPDTVMKTSVKITSLVTKLVKNYELGGCGFKSVVSLKF